MTKQPKHLLKVRVLYLYIALFLVNLLVTFLLLTLPFLLIKNLDWNTPSFRSILFLVGFTVLSIIDFRFLYRRFITVVPTALSLYRYDDSPRLHYNDDPKTSIVITWHTAEKTRGHIQFGDSESTMIAYELEPNVFLHRKSFESLKPGQRYYYQVQQSGPVYSFKTAPENSDKVTFAVIGDTQNGGGLGDPDWSFPTIADCIVKEKNVDLVIHLGDITDQGNDLRSWREIFKASSEMWATIPMHIAIGNHDTGTNFLQDKEAKRLPDEGANFDYFIGYRYAAPAWENQTTSFRGRYYSFDYANCHFLMLDSHNSANAYPENPQWSWIKEDLNSVPPDKWKIACIHRDLVKFQKKADGSPDYRYDRFAQYIVPLLHECGVDFMLQGHEHWFQLLYWKYTEDKAIYRPVSEIKKLEIPYIISGGAGNEMRRNPRLEFESPNLDSKIIREDSSHYLIVSIEGNKAKFTAKYPDNSILYEFSLSK